MRRSNTNVSLRIYPFGASIDKESFQDLHESNSVAERDRSGANREETLSTIQERIEEKHGQVWQAQNIA